MARVTTHLGGREIEVEIPSDGSMFRANSSIQDVPRTAYSFIDSCEIPEAASDVIRTPAPTPLSLIAPPPASDIPKTVIAALLPCEEPGHYPCPDIITKTAEIVTADTLTPDMTKIRVKLGDEDHPDYEADLVVDFDMESHCCCNHREGENDRVEITPKIGWIPRTRPRFVPVVGTFGCSGGNFIVIPSGYNFGYPGTWPLVFINPQAERREWECGDFITGVMDTQLEVVYSGFFFNCSGGTIVTCEGDALGLGYDGSFSPPRPILPTDLHIDSTVNSCLRVATEAPLKVVGEFMEVDSSKQRIRGSNETILHIGFGNMQNYYHYRYNGKYCIALKTKKDVWFKTSGGSTFSLASNRLFQGGTPDGTFDYTDTYNWCYSSTYGILHQTDYLSSRNALDMTPGSSMTFTQYFADTPQSMEIFYYKPRWESDSLYGVYNPVDGAGGTMSFGVETFLAYNGTTLVGTFVKSSLTDASLHYRYTFAGSSTQKDLSLAYSENALRSAEGLTADSWFECSASELSASATLVEYHTVGDVKTATGIQLTLQAGSLADSSDSDTLKVWFTSPGILT